MYKVGDPIDGYCSKCRRNAFMSVAATDGRELFATVCRTCHTQQDYKCEISAEEVREQAAKKLMRMAARKRRVPTGRGPEVVSRSRRVDEGDLVESDTPAHAAPRGGSRIVASSPPVARPLAADVAVEGGIPGRRRSAVTNVAEVQPDAVAPAPEVLKGDNEGVTELWRQRTASLGPRDGKVYYADRSYDIGDVLLHKRYGMGIVEAIVNENAAMVLFRDARQVIEMGQPR
jgi:hypothetical protein